MKADQRSCCGETLLIESLPIERWNMKVVDASAVVGFESPGIPAVVCFRGQEHRAGQRSFLARRRLACAVDHRDAGFFRWWGDLGRVVTVGYAFSLATRDRRAQSGPCRLREQRGTNGTA